MRLSYKGCKDENNKNKVAGMPSVLFAFCTVYCRGNRLKINITPYGKSSIIQLTELKFKIWRVTFFKSIFNHWEFWDRLQFSRNNGFMTCIYMHLRWRNPCNWKLDRFRFSSLVLASEWSSNRKLFVALLGMTKCMHRTTPYCTWKNTVPH